MTNGSAASIPASSAHRRAPYPQDDGTVVAPPHRAKQGTSDEKHQEKTLRLRFPDMTGGNSIVAPPVLHYHFIAAVQDAFIQFLDNNNRVVNKIDLVRFDIQAQRLLSKEVSHSHQKLLTQMIAAQQSMFLTASVPPFQWLRVK
jgi:hypothetical protein